ncbi:MAG TPA: ABC transporter substrate-binding protein [Firmicutes bacterium]|nr:ABC transporter substrate-binding protein [Bacillota bacterium]
MINREVIIMRKNSSLIAALMLVLMIAVIAAGSGNFGQAAEPININIMALSGTTGLSMVKMFEDNPVLSTGVNVTYSIVSNPQQMTAKIISGEADIAAVPTNTAALLYNKGIAIKIGAITNWGVTYLAGRDLSVKKWTDLKGKTIAVTGKGATPDILFRRFLKANGLDPERDVKLEYYPTPAELAQLVIAEKTDLAVIPEPWVTEVMLRSPSARVLLDFQEEWKRLENRKESYPQSCLVVSTKLYQEHPEVVKTFLQQAGLASDWVNDNRAQAGILAEKFVKISANAATDAIPRCNFRFAIASSVKNEVDYFLNSLFEFDPEFLGGKLPDAAFYLPQ